MEKNGPLVSVLMTAYNREALIPAAIESVLASTYTDLELIIVDDGSKDRTVEVARGYAQRDARVKVYLNEKNLGDYPNRNRAAVHATGKYLKYVDADDAIYPWGLELLVGMMEEFPQAGWGLCSLDQYRERPFPFQLTPPEAYAYHYKGPGIFHKAPLSSIIRRDVFIATGGFAPERMVGDKEMWHRLALSYNVVLMPHGMVWYREHDQQEVKSYDAFIPKYEEITVRYLSRPDCPLDRESANAILRKMKKSAAERLTKSLIKLDFGQARTNWKCLQLYRAQ